MSKFPPLRLAILSGLSDIKDNLDLLDTDECPYDIETRAFLKKLLAPVIVEKTVEKEIVVEGKTGRGRPTKDVRLGTEDQQQVLDDIKSTLTDLKEMADDKTLPTNERIQIAKTKTNLLDQLLKMMERHTTVQKMQNFIEQVIALLDDLVSEADRELFMKRMEAFR